MTSSRSAVRFISHSLIALGLLGMGLAVGRGLSTGRLFELGSNNLIVFITGFVVTLAGWACRHPGLASSLDRALTSSGQRTPAFLAGLARRPVFYITLAVWAGVAQGLAEAAYRLYHDVAPPWRHSLWLAPIGYAAVFSVLGVVLSLTGRRDPTGRTQLHLTLSLLITLSGVGLLLITLPQVHVIAGTLLAAGVAVQLSRLLVAHAALVGDVARTARWVLPVVLAFTMLWALGAEWLGERRRTAARPDAPTDARNVVLIVLDTVRAQSLSLLGYHRPTTPMMERWAERGIVFESAIATAPWTLPSHAGMFTGRWPHELSTGWVGSLDGRFPTIAETLRDQGYATAGFVANLVFTTRQTGLARGFDRYEDFTIGIGEAILSTSLGRAFVTSNWIRNGLQFHELANRKVAAAISADFLDWLDGTDGSPFFAFLNYFDAHEPYMPPKQYAELFRSGPRVHRGAFRHHENHAAHADWWGLSPDQIANEQALYDAAIASQDHEIGRLLEALDERGVLGNTVVIVTSDHGEHFGEHGLFTHGHNLYMPQLHVPLWILMPETTDRRRITDSVSLRDIPNTVLDLAGLAGTQTFPGASLARFWSPHQAPAQADPMYISLFPAAGADAEPTPAARGTMRSIIEDPYHYILNGDGVEEIFNYRSDPGETHDLIGTPAADVLLQRFRKLLETETP